MGLFDGLKKMVGVVDQGEALVQDNDKVRKQSNVAKYDRFGVRWDNMKWEPMRWCGPALYFWEIFTEICEKVRIRYYDESSEIVEDWWMMQREGISWTLNTIKMIAEPGN